MEWQVIESGPAGAGALMAKDGELLANVGEACVLHLYEWEGEAATHGYFVKPREFFDMEAVERSGLDLARRPTGGGIVLHMCDLAFSVVVPREHEAYGLNTLERYQWVNRRVARAIGRFCEGLELELLAVDPKGEGAESHFCMAKPTIYDIMVGGRKVGGAAQRKTRAGFLHQGTIALLPPPSDLLQSLLRPETGVLAAMQKHTHALLGESATGLQAARARLRELLVEVFTQKEE